MKTPAREPDDCDRPPVTRVRRPAAYLHWLIAGLAVTAPLALGGALPATSIAISVGALTCSATVVAASRRRADARLPWLAVAAFGAPLLVTMLQLVPFSCDWLPPSSLVRQSIEELHRWGHRDARCTQTLAPATTQLRLAEWVALFAAFTAAHWLASTRGPRLLYRGLVFSASVMALFALGHWLVQAQTVFGIYEPLHATNQVMLAPLLNPNHLAGLMVLGLAPSAALAVRAREPRARLLWGLCGTLVLVCLLMTLSRAGIGLGLASLVPVALNALGRERLQRRARTTAIAGIAAGVAVTGFMVTEIFVANEEDFTSLDKLRQVANSALSIQEHPWLGVGRGALPVAAGLRGDWLHRKTYVENLPVQWAMDWGFPATFISLACFGLLFRRVWRRPGRGFVDRAVLVALLMLCLQNLLDFSLELPGVALVAIVALGAMTGSTQGSLPGISCRKLAASLAVGGALLLVIMGPSATQFADVYTLEQRLRHVEAHESPDRLLQNLEHAITAQPHEAAVALWWARANAASNPRQTFRWLNRTIRLAPEWEGPHLVAAELLMRQGAFAQAILELGQAARRAPRKAGLLACAFERYTYPHEPLLRIVPPSAPWTFARSFIFCLDSQNKAFAEPLAQTVLSYAPKTSNVRHLLARRQLQRGAAEDALGTLNAMPENDIRFLGLRCRALAALGRLDEAIAITREIEDFEALACRVGAQAKLKDAAGLASSLERLERAAAQNEGLRIHALAIKSGVYYDSGDYLGSVTAAPDAYRLSGEVRWLERAHAVSVKAGLLGTAYTTRRELCRTTKNKATACQGGLR